MQITREADYAIRCVLYLAEHKDQVSAVSDISEKQEVPRTFTSKILQKLAKANIVSSERGVKGGFILSREAYRITLLDVIEAVEGPLSLNICVIDSKSCNRSTHCTVHPVWIKMNEEFKKSLSKYTIDNFV